MVIPCLEFVNFAATSRRSCGCAAKTNAFGKPQRHFAEPFRRHPVCRLTGSDVVFWPIIAPHGSEKDQTPPMRLTHGRQYRGDASVVMRSAGDTLDACRCCGDLTGTACEVLDSIHHITPRPLIVVERKTVIIISALSHRDNTASTLEELRAKLDSPPSNLSMM
jgi:hypothetical protein